MSKMPTMGFDLSFQIGQFFVVFLVGMTLRFSRLKHCSHLHSHFRWKRLNAPVEALLQFWGAAATGRWKGWRRWRRGKRWKRWRRGGFQIQTRDKILPLKPPKTPRIKLGNSSTINLLWILQQKSNNFSFSSMHRGSSPWQSRQIQNDVVFKGWVGIVRFPNPLAFGKSGGDPV